MVQLQARDVSCHWYTQIWQRDTIDTDVDGFIIPIRDVEMLQNKMKFIWKSRYFKKDGKCKENLQII